MKEFKAPEVKFIMLENDVIATSGIVNCPPYNCGMFTCDDCASCTGTYSCISFLCSTYQPK